jgi:uncharacterized membrane protein
MKTLVNICIAVTVILAACLAVAGYFGVAMKVIGAIAMIAGLIYVVVRFHHQIESLFWSCMEDVNSGRDEEAEWSL